MAVSQSDSHLSSSADTSYRLRSAAPFRSAAVKAADPSFEKAWTIRELAEACYVVRHTIMYYMRRGDFKTLHRRNGRQAVEADEARRFVAWYLAPHENGAIFPATTRDVGRYVTVSALMDRLEIARGLVHYHLQRADGLGVSIDALGTYLLTPEAADDFCAWYQNPAREYGSRFPHLRRGDKQDGQKC